MVNILFIFSVCSVSANWSSREIFTPLLNFWLTKITTVVFDGAISQFIWADLTCVVNCETIYVGSVSYSHSSRRHENPSNRATSIPNDDIKDHVSPRNVSRPQKQPTSTCSRASFFVRWVSWGALWYQYKSGPQTVGVFIGGFERDLQPWTHQDIWYIILAQYILDPPTVFKTWLFHFQNLGIDHCVSLWVCTS